MRPLRTGWPHEFADLRLPEQVAPSRTLGIERFSMSKDNIQDVVKKSLEKYFRDLGEMQPHNVYEMVVFTVEKPMLEAVMARANGNQSHAAEMLGINRNTLRKKLQQHGLL
jgi:Fis family transcriptional regulator, factor for inversion stimulation protein